MMFEAALSTLDRLSKQAKAPLICVYKHPKDYPEKYVARLWAGDMPTASMVVADSMEEIRAAKPPQMAVLQRHPDDDPIIVEIWL